MKLALFFAAILALSLAHAQDVRYYLTYDAATGRFFDTYNPSNPYDRGPVTSVYRSYAQEPSFFYTEDRYGKTLRINSQYTNFFAYQPHNTQPWSCVGNGCSKTPYLPRSRHYNAPHSYYW